MRSNWTRHFNVATAAGSISSTLHKVCGIAGLALSTLAVLSTVMVLPARAISINDEAAAAVGGVSNYYDSTNKYPYVAATRVDGVHQCTGTLINSRTLLTAAHCFYDQNNVFNGGPTAGNNFSIHTVSFGTTATNNTPANNDRTVTSLALHEQYNRPYLDANDFALITFNAPVTGITPVVLATSNSPVPGKGTEVTLVGYGGYGTGTNCCQLSDNKRRMATTSLAGLIPRNEQDRSSLLTQLFYYAQFRDPLFPNAINDFNLTTQPGEFEGGTVGGDSGGPMFAFINGVFTQIGVVRGGGNQRGNTSEYGDIGDWTPVQLYTDWIAVNNPLRSLVNKSGNFNWSNAGAWTDSVASVAARTPNNTVGNVADYQTDRAYYFDVTLANAGRMTLDLNAGIDTLSIVGAQSSLAIPTGTTLTTEIGTGISNGSLLMSGGTLASPTVLMTGGLLAGNGTLTGTGTSVTTNLINSGGMVVPQGTLAVQGNFIQFSGSTQFRGNANGVSDLLTVSGSASLGGNAAAIVQPGLYNRTTSLTVINAGSVAGTFANVASSSPFFTTTAVYSGTTVNLTLNRVGFGAVAGMNANQQALGNALEGGYSTSLTGNAATFYANLLGAPNFSALNQLNGEAGPSGTQSGFVATTQFMNSMFDAAFDNASAAGGAIGFAAENDALGYAQSAKLSKQAGEAYAAVTPRDRITKAPDYRSFDTRWNVWGTVYGGYSRTAGDASLGSNTTSSRVYGVVGGADYKVSPNTRIGFAVGGSGSNYSVGMGLGGGNADTFHFGVYAKHNIGAAYLAAGVSYAWQDVSTERTINILGTDTLRASFNANALAARLEGGYRFVTPAAIGITPYAALQSTTFFLPSYGETAASGINTFALNFASKDVTATRGELGLRWDTALSSTLTLKARTAWAHDWNRDRSATATFQGLPGTSSFTVNGGTPSADAALLSLGASLKFGRGWSVLASYEGEYSNNSSSNGGKGTLKYEW